MTKKTVYLGLGANLETPILQLRAARRAIGEIAGVDDMAFSSLYRSPPMGPQNQPDYVNAVMQIATCLPALDLLSTLQEIENAQGRVRLERWGARTLDIDILLYGEERIDLPTLTVPHLGMMTRAFVLYPLFELSPELVINGHALVDLVHACPLNGLERLAREF